ncbi:hypothetical protein J5Y09_23600 [Roseomonas sp. PWR1]|uniref:Uncharacterized protein n=1 Tax=Roseomonas nitratireducens TaxID=2820810 RepID=A0ABS4B1I5_9PROT|nr:hypothetical protein [Neoroseomonas nitratireducens]MBP0466933.1 hypothetical protein [Neoroseomonas nitratireducens]
MNHGLVEMTYGSRTARISSDIWPPAWNIDALDPEVARGIVNWFRATDESPRQVVTPIEIVLQMVLSYLNIDTALHRAPAQERG